MIRRGARPLTAAAARRSGSRDSRAVPLIRKVSSMPGMKNSSPTLASATIFDVVSSNYRPDRRSGRGAAAAAGIVASGLHLFSIVLTLRRGRAKHQQGDQISPDVASPPCHCLFYSYAFACDINVWRWETLSRNSHLRNGNGANSRCPRWHLFDLKTVLARDENMAGFRLEGGCAQRPLRRRCVISIDYLLRGDVPLIGEIVLYGACQAAVLIFDVFRLRRRRPVVN